MAEKVKLAPNIFSYPDFEHADLHMEISLGGVKKEDITLRMSDDSFFIRVPQDDFEYVTSMRFDCPVKASEARANFEYGVLKVVIPFKDRLEEGIPVKVA
ncbi:MAG: Hsp20/alpha crystallin family protein [Desulfobacterales bacterium]